MMTVCQPESYPWGVQSVILPHLHSPPPGALQVLEAQRAPGARLDGDGLTATGCRLDLLICGGWRIPPLTRLSLALGLALSITLKVGCRRGCLVHLWGEEV